MLNTTASHRYPTRPDVVALDNINLSLEPGQLVALVGLSGSGKSTLVALLQRLYDPTGGQVRAVAALLGHRFLLLVRFGVLCPQAPHRAQQDICCFARKIKQPFAWLQVLIDGAPLDEVDAQWYRSQIGVVSQDPRLFSTTVAANITYGCPNRTQVSKTGRPSSAELQSTAPV